MEVVCEKLGSRLYANARFQIQTSSKRGSGARRPAHIMEGGVKLLLDWAIIRKVTININGVNYDWTTMGGNQHSLEGRNAMPLKTCSLKRSGQY